MADSQDISYFLDQVWPALGCHDCAALRALTRIQLHSFKKAAVKMNYLNIFELFYFLFPIPIMVSHLFGK